MECDQGKEVSKHPWPAHSVLPTAPLSTAMQLTPLLLRVCFVAGEERGEREGGLRTDDDKARVQGVQYR